MSILPIFIPHAGCPHQCVFCNQKTISGQKQAAIDAAKGQIVKWCQWIKPNVANEAAFYGGSFTALPFSIQEQLLQLSDELIERKIIGSVRISTRPDYIDCRVLELLQQHNVRLVELGVQSLDDNVLKMAERGHQAAIVTDAVNLLKGHGFLVGLQLMVGMPGQTFASLQDTVKKVILLNPDIARVYPLLVIKDTALARDFKQGNFVPLSLEEAIEQSAYVYQALTEASIKVIRIGLQPDEELCKEGNILAGPFHPAMGELVKSRVIRNIITPLLRKNYEKNIFSCVIEFTAQMESKVRGQKNNNLLYWRQLFPQLKLAFKINNNLKNQQIKVLSKE